MKIFYRFLILLLVPLFCKGYTQNIPGNLNQVEILEREILSVNNPNIFKIEFYDQNTIHYVEMNPDNGVITHTYIDLTTMSIQKLNGFPSPSKTQYITVEGKCNEPVLCVYYMNETVPYLTMKIPKRNDYPVLRCYWISDNEVILEGDRIWKADLNFPIMKVVAESTFDFSENATTFYRSDEFPNLCYIGSNRNGFYYLEYIGMKNANLYFVSNTDGESVLLNNLTGYLEALFFDGRVFYRDGNWKYTDDTNIYLLDVETVFLQKYNDENILYTISKTGQLTLHFSNFEQQERYQLKSPFFTQGSYYIDDTSILCSNHYYNWKTDEFVNLDWQGTLPNFDTRKLWIPKKYGKGFFIIDVEWEDNDRLYQQTPIRSFKVKEVSIEEIRN